MHFFLKSILKTIRYTVKLCIYLKKGSPVPRRLPKKIFTAFGGEIK
jgi:hypothetical protein